jgi:ATP-dependent DNA helicase RecG
LREAVINAIIHNDYSTELVPKFEVFNDRLEITSSGTIHSGQEQDDFFAGYSMPRNKTLMRVFKDLGMVEYLGSGMPRILKAYPREAFTFSTHFIRLAFPVSQEALALEKEVLHGELQPRQTLSGVESGVESAMGMQTMELLQPTPLSKAAIARALGKEKPTRYLNELMKKLLERDYVAYTIPEKPNSRLQKYRLTAKGSTHLKKVQKSE